MPQEIGMIDQVKGRLIATAHLSVLKSSTTQMANSFEVRCKWISESPADISRAPPTMFWAWETV